MPASGGVSLKGFLRFIAAAVPMVALVSLVQYVNTRSGKAIGTDVLWLAASLVWIWALIVSARRERAAGARGAQIGTFALLLLPMAAGTWSAWSLIKALAF
jgi:hypothetical protein